MLRGFVLAGVSCLPSTVDVPKYNYIDGMSGIPVLQQVIYQNSNFSTGNLDFASGVFSSELFRKEISEDKFLTEIQIQAQDRYEALETSFISSSKDVPNIAYKIFNVLAHKLSSLNYIKEHAFYNVVDESVDIYLSLRHNVQLGVSRFIDNDDNTIMCTLHKSKDLLYANMLNLSDLESRIAEMIKILEDDEFIS